MNLFNNRNFNWLLIFDIKLIGWNLHIPLQSFQTSFMYMCVCISCGSEAKLWASIIWSNFPSAQNNVQSSQWVGGRITHKPTCTNVQALREKGLRYQYLCSTSCGKKQEVLCKRGRDPDDLYWLKSINEQRTRCKFTYRLQFNPVWLIGLLLQQIHDEALHRMVIWKRISPALVFVCVL